MRQVYCCHLPYLMIGSDLSGVEARLLGHFTSFFDEGEMARELLDGDIHCYSGSTEVLTKSGWRRLDELEEGIEVAQFNKNTDEISFVIPTNYIKSFSNSLLLHKKSRLFVTDNHRHLLESFRSKKRREVLEKDITYTNGDYRLLTAGIKLEGIVEDELLLKAVVAAQADGSRSTSGSYRFEFKKSRKINRFRDIFKGFYTESYNHRRGTVRFTLSGSIPIDKYLTEKKELNYNLLELSYESIKVILKEVEFWDGTRNGSSVVLDTTSTQTVEVLNTLCSLAGIKSSCSHYRKKTIYGYVDIDRIIISFECNPYIGVLGDNPDRVIWNKDVYCLSVPTSWILTRHDGVISVSGNSKNAALIGKDRNTAKTFFYA